MPHANAKLLIDLGQPEPLEAALRADLSLARRPFFVAAVDGPRATTPLVWTALQLRARRLSVGAAVRAAEALLAAGAEIDAMDGEGETPLSAAAAPGCGALARWLLSRGAHMDMRVLHAWGGETRFEGGAALHWAAVRGGLKALEALLEAGAEIDAPCRGPLAASPLGWAQTALSEASGGLRRRLAEGVDLLKAAGASEAGLGSPDAAFKVDAFKKREIPPDRA